MRTYALRGTAETNKVLRNTFALLALTLLPTVLGVFVGMDLGLPAMAAESPWLTLLGMLAVSIALLFGIYATATSAMAVPLTLLFTFVMGASLSTSISVVLGAANGGAIIALAALGTAGLLVGCSIYAMTTTKDFSGMGSWLLGALLAVIVVSVANIFIGAGWLALLLAIVTLILFSVFLVYDVQQVVNGGETNYVLATVAIYLDLINIFSSLLQILFSFVGDD